MSPVPLNASPSRVFALLATILSASLDVHADSFPETLDRFGSAVAHGDFDGDDYGDLAVGAPYESFYEYPDLYADAGAVDVIYGSSAGLTPTAHQFWHRGIDGLEGEREACYVVPCGQYFGQALAAADFNGDTYDDLAVGVPGDNVPYPDDVEEGAVSVIYGSVRGLYIWDIPDQLWHQDSPNVPEKAESKDRFGAVLAAGDFNDDGYADLAVGVPYEDVGSIVDAGAVDVIYGSAAGLSTTIQAQHWHQNTANVAEAGEADDRFGYALAVGDFNSDSYDDLAIGVLYESVGAVPGAGAVHVIHGSASGLSATIVPDQLWHQNSSGIDDTAEEYDHFGTSLIVGDFNCDTRADLAVGVFTEDIDGGEDTGAVHVLYAGPGGLTAFEQFLYQFNNGYWVIGDGLSEDNDYFGSALAAGDFNLDGCADLSIGVGENLNNVGEGAVAVVYGTEDGLDALEGGSQFWSQDSAFVEDTAETYDDFGDALAAGDFNHDDLIDLAIGVTGEDTAAGAVNVIYGTAGGLSPTLGLPDQFWTQGGYVQQ